MRFGLMFLYPVNSVNVGGASQTAATNTPAAANGPEKAPEEVKTEKVSIFSNYDTSQDGKINNGDTMHQSLFQLDTGKLNALTPSNITDNAANISSIKKIANAQLGGVANKFSEMVNSFSVKIGKINITQKVGANFTAQNNAEIQSKTSELNSKVENSINQMSNKYNQMIFDLYSQALNDVAQQIGNSNPEIPQGGENDKIFIDTIEQPEGIGTGRNEDGSIKHLDGSESNIQINGKKPEAKVETNTQDNKVAASPQNDEAVAGETDISDETIALEDDIKSRFEPQPGSLEKDGAIGGGTRKKYGTCYQTKGTVSFEQASQQLGVDIATLQKFNPQARTDGEFKNGNDIYVPFGAENTKETPVESETQAAPTQVSDLSGPTVMAPTPDGSALRDISSGAETIVSIADMEPENITGMDIPEVVDEGVEISTAEMEPENITGMDIPEVVDEGVEISTANMEPENITGMDIPEVVDEGVEISTANMEPENITGTGAPEVVDEGVVISTANMEPENITGTGAPEVVDEGVVISTANMEPENITGTGAPEVVDEVPENSEFPRGSNMPKSGSGFPRGSNMPKSGSGFPRGSGMPSGFSSGPKFPSGSNMPSFEDRMQQFDNKGERKCSIGMSEDGSLDVNYDLYFATGGGKNSKISSQFESMGFDTSSPQTSFITVNHEIFTDLINKQNSGAELTQPEQKFVEKHLKNLEKLGVKVDANGNIIS